MARIWRRSLSCQRVGYSLNAHSGTGTGEEGGGRWLKVRGPDVGRSWLKVALRCSVSSWTADGGGRGRLAVCKATAPPLPLTSALAYRGEARCIVYESKALYCPQVWVDVPPKVATTTTHRKRSRAALQSKALISTPPIPSTWLNLTTPTKIARRRSRRQVVCPPLPTHPE